LKEDSQKPDNLKFYVRQGNRTIELTGPQADEYKTENLRGQ
jgi:hypothetical protein